MSGAAERIEAFFAERYGREALYLPSGRLALYLVFQEWLKPGDRLLLSPVDDDVVFFTVLAAGLRPVLGPLDPRTGNLDPDRIDEATWASLDAVMTTNLYGIPDRMDRLAEQCARHDLLLIEDACQALESAWDGRRIGGLSSVAAFSLTKHVDGVGGVLAFSDARRRSSLQASARKETLHPDLPTAARRALSAAARGTKTGRALRRVGRLLVPPAAERPGHRMAYHKDEVLRAQAAGAGLDRFDRWVRVDNHQYRTTPTTSGVEQTVHHLERLEESRRLRLDGARKLLDLGLTPPDVDLPYDTAFFRVPLFVRDREHVVHRLGRRGLALDYIYDPPLDEYASADLADALPSPPEAIRWSRDVLPVDPLLADKFLALLADIPALEGVSPVRPQGGADGAVR